MTSRLEGLTKLYGVTAVVGEATLMKSAKKFPALELDVAAVRGRTRSTRVFTFLELLGREPNRLEGLQRMHGEFLAAYRARQWDEAERLLAECREFGIAGWRPIIRSWQRGSPGRGDRPASRLGWLVRDDGLREMLARDASQKPTWGSVGEY